MPRITLIDGSSYLFRAFHALPPLTNAAGEPTGALYGVVSMLRTTLETRPDYAAFVSDASGPTFRNEMYAEYKANRAPMPDELRAQIEPMLAIVHALGLPMFRVAGVEADDVIGTLARQAEAAGIEVVISTSDKDFAQLVSPRIRLLNTMTRSSTDAARVKEKFGVEPAQFIDFLALTGDSVDNVPGVPKCGPKTAAKWLGQYGTLDALLEHADEVGGKIGENLRAALPQLPLSRELVTIKTDVALDRAVQQLTPVAPDTPALRELYTRYGFSTELKKLDFAAEANSATVVTASVAVVATDSQGRDTSPDAATEGGTAQPASGQYELVTTGAQLDAWIKRLSRAKLIAFDTETTSLDPMRAELVGLSLAVEPGAACYVPLAHECPGVPVQLDRDEVLNALRPILEDPERPKLGQHIKYDMNVLSNYGITLRGVAHDSMLESYIWNATGSRHDMDSLAMRYLGYQTISYTDVAGKGAKQIPFAAVELDVACRYAAEDADITLRLHQTLWPQLRTEPGMLRVYQDLEIPLVPVLARMEQRGVLIDVDELRRQSQDLGSRMLEVRAQAFALAGTEFSLDSPKQLQSVLFDQLGLPALVKTPKGQPSTNEEAMAAIADQHELPRLILAYRGYAKLRSTYTDKLPQMVNPRSGRVHTSYHQATAATGRLSSADPNLQNIPIRTVEGRRIRTAFIAQPGWRVLAADYSQIELRIMAHLSRDAGLLRAFGEGGDIHRATAAEVFGLAADAVGAEQRRAAKAINFGLMYGMSAFGLARNLGISRGDAQAYIDLYFARYPGVRAFMDATRAQAREQGHVETMAGRRLYLPDLKASKQARRAGAERAAINAPMQGTAADIIKQAMIDVDGWLSGRADAFMIMQVHDELVLEVREDAVDEVRAGLAERMSAAAQLEVPLVVDTGVGANWNEAH